MEDIANTLAGYSLSKRIRVLRAARCLRKYNKLTNRKLTREEELEKEIEELEEE